VSISSAAGLVIRPARRDDLAAVTATLAAAFLHGDLAGWLIPDPATRRNVYGGNDGYFAMFADYFLYHGLVDASDDLAAVALWWPVGDQLDLDIPDYTSRLAKMCGPAVGRFLALDMTMHAHHPTRRPHDYLTFLAVHPDRHGHGLGSALLRHHHTRLDTAGSPAYLEATGIRNRALYTRHGYQPSPPITIPGGLQLHPMWRPAQR
jgi:GNAT superfamily N-acetyltransferase